MALTAEQNRTLALLYQDMFQPLYQYANSALRNPSLAEEAVQDTFRIACANSTACLESPNPKGWLLETLKNVIRNIRRSLARQNNLVTKLTSLAEMQPDSDSILPEDDIVSLRAACMSALGEEDFQLFWRVAMDKLTMAEAAREFGIHTETCKKRIQRARAKIKDYLKNFC